MPPDSRFGQTEWVLSRPLYRFVRFDLKSVPRAQRGQALDLKIAQWTPFTRTAWYLLWEQDHALVWAWDADQVAQSLAAHKLKSKGTAVIPETLLHPRQAQGSYLVTCMDGYEGQVWVDGSLTVSRWWAQIPALHEWKNFERDAGIAPQQQRGQVPVPQSLTWNDKPWGKSMALATGAGYGGKAESWIVTVAILALAGATMWQAMQLIKLRSAAKQQAAELKMLEEKAQPLVQARGQALETLDQIQRLQGEDIFPDPLFVLARVAELLPKDKDAPFLKEWEYLGGKLKLHIASTTKLSTTDYIKLFEASGIFRSVQVMPASDSLNLVMTMETLPRADIKEDATNTQIKDNPAGTGKAPEPGKVQKP